MFLRWGDLGKVAVTKTGRNDIRYVVWAISKGSTRQHETTTNIDIRNDKPKVIRDVDASRTPDTFFSILIYTDSCIFTSHVYEWRKRQADSQQAHLSYQRVKEQQGAERARDLRVLSPRTVIGAWGVMCLELRSLVSFYIFIYTLLLMTIHVLLLIKLLVFAMVIWVWDMRPINVVTLWYGLRKN